MSSTRQRIVDHLDANGSMPTGQIAEAMLMSVEATRFHMRVLESDGMVEKTKVSRGFVWKSTCDGPVPEHKPSGRPPGDKRAMLSIQNTLDEEGQLTRKDLAAITSLPEKRVSRLLSILESEGKVWHSGRFWSLRGNRKAKPVKEGISDWIDYQRKTPIGRFLTQPAGVPV